MITKERIGYISETEVISAWFAAKLIPDYVDTVTVDGDAVVFVKDGETIATFKPSATNPLTVNINATNTLSTRHGTGTSTTTALYGFACKSAVAVRYIHAETGNNPFGGGFAFTKDNTGETVIVASQAFDSVKNTELSTAYAVRRDENIGATVPKPYTFTARQSSATVMRPFQIYTHDGSIVYTPDTFLCETYQHADICKISANGTDYLSFGVWAFRDEKTPSSGGASAEEIEAIRADMRKMENALSASIADFGATAETHYSDENNPHGVTPEQIGAYTNKEVDALFSKFAGVGIALAGDADVDTVTEIGRYRVASAANAGTIANLPAAVAGSLIVLPSNTADTSRLMQLYIPNWGTTNQLGVIHIRQLVSGGWSQWFKVGDTTPTALLEGDDLNNLSMRDCEYYTLTPQIAASIQNSPYTNGVFRLEVKFITGGAAQPKCVQVIYPADGSCYYSRAYNSTDWSNWYRYAGTGVAAEPE